MRRSVFTVAEFCAAYRMSRPTLYALWRNGEGPPIFTRPVETPDHRRGGAGLVKAAEKQTAKAAKAGAKEMARRKAEAGEADGGRSGQ